MLSEEKMLESLSITDGDQILFNAWAEMRKFLRKSTGRFFVVRRKDGEGFFYWRSDLTRSTISLQGMGGRAEDLYSIVVKGRIVSFSWSDKYRFKFKSESEANECWRLLNNV